MPNSLKSKALQLIFLSLIVCLTSSCSTLQLQSPHVSVKSISPLQGSGLELGLIVNVEIANPNAVALSVRGLEYSLSVNNSRVLQGVSNNIPTIPAYGTEAVALTLKSDLISASKLLFKLLKEPQQVVSYSFNGSMDLANYLPKLRFNDSGEIPLK